MVKLRNPLKRSSQKIDAEPELEDMLDPDRIEFVSIEEGKELLDEQARQYLNMSGEEFQRKYRAGEFEDYCQSEVVRLSFLLPFVEFQADDQEEHVP